MNSQDKFLFIRSIVNNNSKLKFLSKQGLDTRTLLSQYGGVTSRAVSDQQVNADYSVIEVYNVRYNQSLIGGKK